MLAKAAEPLLAKLQDQSQGLRDVIKVGNLYYDGQAYPQAIEYYKRRWRFSPRIADVQTDLGTAYWYTGNPDKAIASLRSHWQSVRTIRERYST